MKRFTIEEAAVWSIDDYYSEIGGPERIDLAGKWIYEMRKFVAKNKITGKVDLVIIVNSHKPINPLNNAALKYIYIGINQELSPEKPDAIKEVRIKNFLVPRSQNQTIEILIYEDSDKD